MVENEHSILKPGKIYITYQGVGKSSTVDEEFGFIDLESSNFRNSKGLRSDDWFEYYGNTAFDLASQSYSVFTSSHDVVRKYLAAVQKSKYPNIKIAVIVPTLNLKDKWIKRLEDRYLENPTRKNEAALGNAKDRYSENIKEILEDADKFGFEKIIINTTDYKLINLLPRDDYNVI